MHGLHCHPCFSNAATRSFFGKEQTERLLLSLKTIRLKRFGCSQNRGLGQSPLVKKNPLTDAILLWWHASSFFLSKPRAVEVTCYQPVKVMAVAPVSTSSIYTTVPGTAVCAFAFCVCVSVCVLKHAERFIHPRTPTSQQLCLGRDPELAGTRTETGKNTSYPDEFNTYLVFGMGTIATKGMISSECRHCSVQCWSSFKTSL